MAYLKVTKKHSAHWLLAVLVALGAGQAVPLANARESRGLSAFVQILAARGEQHIRRKRPIRARTRQVSEIFLCFHTRIEDWERSINACLLRRHDSGELAGS